MARQKPTDKLATLKAKMAELAAQAQALEARAKENDRKADTRRKVIAGALAIEHMDKNGASEFGKVMLRLLDEYVTRPADRALFPALPHPAQKNGAGHNPPPVTTEFKEAEREHV